MTISDIMMMIEIALVDSFFIGVRKGKTVKLMHRAMIFGGSNPNKLV